MILTFKAAISSLFILPIDKLFPARSVEKRLSKLTPLLLKSQIYSSFAFKKVLVS